MHCCSKAYHIPIHHTHYLSKEPELRDAVPSYISPFQEIGCLLSVEYFDTKASIHVFRITADELSYHMIDF